MWIVILIVCAISGFIFGFISEPVGRVIKKKVSSKWLTIILELVVYWLILMALYGVAVLLGFNIWK